MGFNFYGDEKSGEAQILCVSQVMILVCCCADEGYIYYMVRGIAGWGGSEVAIGIKSA